MKRVVECTRTGDQFWDALYSMVSNPQVQVLKEFKHHRVSNTYRHCLNVAVTSYKYAGWLRLKVDEKSLAKGAMLHDYYLYTYKNSGMSAYKHSTGHPGIAMENADEIFGLSDVEKDIISTHMWPITFRHVPRTREAVLVCVADKVCAFKEMFLGRDNYIIEKYGIIA